MMNLERLRWRFNRIRAMSVPEVLGRVQFERTKAKWLRSGLPMPPVRLDDAALWQLASNGAFGLPMTPEVLRREAGHEEAQALLAEAEEVLQGRWRFFAFSEQPSLATPDGLTDWHRCDFTGRRADPDAFGPNLDYRDASVVGDVKYTWEKSRHHHTTVLAVAYALTGEDRYARAAAANIAHWIMHNPPLKGVNWASALELGVRLTAWAWCFHLLSPHPDWGSWFGEDSTLWSSVYRHQAFLAEGTSFGSSANNHLLGELTGQYVASVVWPVFEESERWRRAAKAALEREAHRQFFSSGLNREMGYGYHLFALELLLLPALLGERTNEPFSAAYRDVIARAIEVIEVLRDAKGNGPRFGDADDGLAVQLQARQASREDVLLRVGREWLGLDVREPPSGRLAATLLLGADRPRPTRSAPSRFAAQRDGSFALHDAGVYGLVSRRGTPDEVFVLADAGPLGYLSIAGHGHADALAFTLSVGGQEVLIDPGTYAYHTEPAWRASFRSTRAHNTLELDGQDSSVQAGAFMWSHKANAAAQSWQPDEDGGLLVASHDGFERLPGSPTHERTFALRGRTLTLKDTVRGSGRHDVCLNFHFHPSCQVLRASPSVWRVLWPGGQLRIQFDPALNVRLGKGAPPAEGWGWYAPRYGVKQASPSLRGELTASVPITLHTTLEVM